MSSIMVSQDRIEEIIEEMQGLDSKSRALLNELIQEIERLRELVDTIANIGT